jgi:ABC-type Fe3+ transport system substrate-binding protein
MSAFLATAAFGCLVALSSSAPAFAQAVGQLYALAKDERTCVVWASGPPALYDRAKLEFEKKFPGVTVSFTGGLSNVLNAGIEQQLRSGSVETDVAILQTVQDFVRWNRRGLLLPFKPEGFDKISAYAKDSSGAWIAVNTNPMFYSYNSELVRGPLIPTLAIDFLRPQFRGRLVSAYPTYNDASLFAFTSIVRKYGWGFMEHYMKQQPKFVRGHLAAAQSIGSGESLASFDVTVSTALDVQRSGGKIALIGPIDDFLPVVFSAEAILKNAPHPNAAKLYVSWFLSKEWQSQAGVYSSRSDVASPAQLPELSSYRLEDHYLDFVTGEEQVSDLRRRFETYTGPVTGTDAR